MTLVNQIIETELQFWKVNGYFFNDHHENTVSFVIVQINRTTMLVRLDFYNDMLVKLLNCSFVLVSFLFFMGCVWG